MTPAEDTPPLSRRDALRRGAIAAGAIAATGLARPALALAQSSGDDALRDFLVEAIGLEQVTVLAYSTAADTKGIDPKAKSTYDAFGAQEAAHVSALRSVIDQLNFDPPAAPDSPADTSVFDGVDGLEPEAVTRLTDLLGELGKAKSGDQLAALLRKLEADQLTYYVQQGPGLDSFDLATTVAEISGCQAQHLVVLGEQSGDPPEKAAAAVAAVIDKAAAAAPAPADSGSTSTTSSTTTTTGSSSTTTSGSG